MKLTEKGKEAREVHFLNELWMVLSNSTAIPHVVLAAPATTPSGAYLNAGRVLADPPYSSQELKKMGYKAFKAMILTEKPTK